MNSRKNNFKNSQAGFSLILTLLILAGMLAACLAISEIVFRVTRSVGNASNSEMAYYGAETTAEKVLYSINKEYQNVNGLDFEESEDDIDYKLNEIEIKRGCRGSGCLYTDDSLTAPAFEGILSKDQSYELDLDINTASPYGAAITLTGETAVLDSSFLTDLVLDRTTGAPINEIMKTGSDIMGGYSVSTADNFHKIRIVNNSDAGDLHYQIAENPIVELWLKTSGIFHETKRQVTTRLAKWHLYNSDGSLIGGGSVTIDGGGGSGSGSGGSGSGIGDTGGGSGGSGGDTGGGSTECDSDSDCASGEICSTSGECVGSCGDGIINGEDQCDGSELGGATCDARGFIKGDLSCNDNCTFNQEGCWMSDPAAGFCIRPAKKDCAGGWQCEAWETCGSSEENRCVYEGNLCGPADNIPCKLVFLTSATYSANLSGITGADTKCNDLAITAGLQERGETRFIAWLSNSTNNMASRLPQGSFLPYYLVDKTTRVFDCIYYNGVSRFPGIDHVMRNKINKGENGLLISSRLGYVFTGTNAEGGHLSGLCNNWTTNNFFINADLGDFNSDSHYFTNSYVLVCNTSARLYCFEK